MASKMIETINIYYFLKTGNFSEFREIYYGMRKQALLDVLGEPESVNNPSRKQKIPSIYFYGNIEFHFDNEEEGRLIGIQIIPRNGEEKINTLDINYGLLFQSLEYEPFSDLLKKENIPSQIFHQEFDGKDIKRILTKGRVQCIFQEDYNNIFHLYKISKFIHLNSPAIPPTKQVNLSIPLSDYEKIRQMSIQQRKSISSICREFIIGKVKEIDAELEGDN